VASVIEDADAVERTARALRDALQPLATTAVTPPVLQPAAIYLELVGEEIRRSAILAQNDALCLRPDMTIPAARLALGLQRWDSDGFALAYDGRVFRRRDGARPREPRQVGVEWFAPKQASQARDLTALQTAVQACRAVGVDVRVEFGCAGLAERVARAVDAPEGVVRSLRQGKSRFDPPVGLERNAALGEALAKLSPERAAEAVGDLLRLAGIEPIGGRSLREIAERLRDKALARDTGAAAQQAFTDAQALLGIEGEPSEALDRLEKAAAGLGKPQAVLERIAGLRALWLGFQALGLPVEARFKAGFRRGFDYYDGFAFDLTTSHGRLLGGGGRYDRALPALAAAEGLRPPAEWGAVGFSLSPEALAEATA